MTSAEISRSEVKSLSQDHRPLPPRRDLQDAAAEDTENGGRIIYQTRKLRQAGEEKIEEKSDTEDEAEENFIIGRGKGSVHRIERGRGGSWYTTQELRMWDSSMISWRGGKLHDLHKSSTSPCSPTIGDSTSPTHHSPTKIQGTIAVGFRIPYPLPDPPLKPRPLLSYLVNPSSCPSSQRQSWATRPAPWRLI